MLGLSVRGGMGRGRCLGTTVLLRFHPVKLIQRSLNGGCALLSSAVCRNDVFMTIIVRTHCSNICLSAILGH